MKRKQIAIKMMGFWMVFVIVAMVMAWHAAPAFAGFTPTAPPPSATISGPTATISGPTATISGPTATISGPTATVSAPTATPRVTSVPENQTPEMPVTGGQMGGLSDDGIIAVFMGGGMFILLVIIGLVIRQSSRTKAE